MFFVTVDCKKMDSKAPRPSVRDSYDFGNGTKSSSSKTRGAQKD
jgi:hypothetical protein